MVGKEKPTTQSETNQEHQQIKLSHWQENVHGKESKRSTIGGNEDSGYELGGKEK